MKYDEVLAAVRQNSDLADNDQAEKVTRATLELIGQRLSGGEPTELAAQLPPELQDTLAPHTGEAETFDVEEFLQRLARSEGDDVTPEQARNHARAVLSTLARFVTGGELDDVRSQLPNDFTPLFSSSSQS